MIGRRTYISTSPVAWSSFRSTTTYVSRLSDVTVLVIIVSGIVDTQATALPTDGRARQEDAEDSSRDHKDRTLRLATAEHGIIAYETPAVSSALSATIYCEWSARPIIRISPLLGGIRLAADADMKAGPLRFHN